MCQWHLNTLQTTGIPVSLLFTKIVTSGRGLCLYGPIIRWPIILTSNKVGGLKLSIVNVFVSLLFSWKGEVQHKGIIELYSFIWYFLLDITFDAIVNAYHTLQCYSFACVVFTLLTMGLLSGMLYHVFFCHHCLCCCHPIDTEWDKVSWTCGTNSRYERHISTNRAWIGKFVYLFIFLENWFATFKLQYTNTLCISIVNLQVDSREC
jgi:hypothetical protein